MAGSAVAEIYAGCIITWVAAFVALSLRILGLYFIKHRPRVDDTMCFIAFFFATAFTACMLVWTRSFHLGQRLSTDDSARREYILERSRLMLWIIEIVYESSIAASKISILSFYWRLFKYTSIRIPIIILLVTSTVWLVMRTLVVSLQCRPVEYIWDKSVPGGRCLITMSKFFFGTVLAHCVMDVVILCLPAIPILKMQLNLKQKLGVIALFAAGFIVVIASIFVIITSIDLDTNSAQYTVVMKDTNLWATVEVNMAVFCSCLPKLRPVFRRIRNSHSSSNDDMSMHPIKSIPLSKVRLPRDLDDTNKVKRPSRIRASLGLTKSSQDSPQRNTSSGDSKLLFEGAPGLGV